MGNCQPTIYLRNKLTHALSSCFSWRKQTQLLTRPYTALREQHHLTPDLFSCLSPFPSPRHFHFLSSDTEWMPGSMSWHFVFRSSWEPFPQMLRADSCLEFWETLYDYLPNIVPYLQSPSVTCPGFIYIYFHHQSISWPGDQDQGFVCFTPYWEVPSTVPGT